MEKASFDDPLPARPVRTHVVHPAVCFAVTFVGGLWYLWSTGIFTASSLAEQSRPQYGITPYKIYHCTPPPIPIEFLGGIPEDHYGFHHAGKALDKIMSLRAQGEDMDSLSIAVVAPSATLFQKQWGVLKANETEEKKGRPDEDSLYRIASISKMFAAFEMMILREKGVLSLDDPITRFLPNISYYDGSWAKHLNLGGDDRRSSKWGQAPITIRQLASHTAGLGRDYPPNVIKGYPHIDPNETFSPNLEFSKPKIAHSIATLPLVAEQYTYPIYSNVGFGVLGWTLTAAANASSYADLIREDIFEPLGLGSSFGVTEENAGRMVISRMPEESDYDLGNALNAAGGQFSSLSDLKTVMQTFLDPWHNEKALLPPHVMREWTRPMHGWDDGFSEVGVPWEIVKLPDTFGVPRRFYSKGGNFGSHHSEFMFDPTRSSFGVVVLMTGSYHAAQEVATQIIQIYQPVFDRIIAQSASRMYAGVWESEDKKSKAVTMVHKGNVWLKKLILDGEDMFEVLARFGRRSEMGKTRYGLWSTGRKDEFRVAVGLPEPHDYTLVGCASAWVSLDGAFGQVAPIDLMLFGGNLVDGRTMHVPSAGATLKRKSFH